MDCVGDDFGLHISSLSLINRIKFRDTSRNMGGVVFLVPTDEDWPDTVFVSTPTRNYTAADLGQLFIDMVHHQLQMLLIVAECSRNIGCLSEHQE